MAGNLGPAAAHQRPSVATGSPPAPLTSVDGEAPAVAGDPITVGGLCSGIGGLELGLEWAGMETIWLAETDDYASAVLAKHWPEIPNLGDITKVEWNRVPRPTLVCAGFPCQPSSNAGRRRGRMDDRWLWPAVSRALRHLRPRLVLLENVPGILTLGFGEVARDLAALGYDTEWTCLPAAAVGAPHLRWRVFIFGRARDGRAGHLADTDRSGSQDRVAPAGQAERQAGGIGWAQRRGAPVADAAGVGRRAGGGAGPRSWRHPAGERIAVFGDRREDRGRGWSPEPELRRVADGIPARVDRIRCLGNAVVPQVAQLVGERILAAEGR